MGFYANPAHRVTSPALAPAPAPVVLGEQSHHVLKNQVCWSRRISWPRQTYGSVLLVFALLTEFDPKSSPNQGVWCRTTNPTHGGGWKSSPRIQFSTQNLSPTRVWCMTMNPNRWRWVDIEPPHPMHSKRVHIGAFKSHNHSYMKLMYTNFLERTWLIPIIIIHTLTCCPSMYLVESLKSLYMISWFGSKAVTIEFPVYIIIVLLQSSPK